MFESEAFMNEYKTKKQGTQVDTTLVGSTVHCYVKDEFNLNFNPNAEFPTLMQNPMTG